jgi:hypothetical protein
MTISCVSLIVVVGCITLERSIDDEIRLLQAQLALLKEKRRVATAAKQRFKHYCPYCQKNWEGYKEVITECTWCKRHIDVIPAAKGAELDVCRTKSAKFDALVREKGSVVYTPRGGNKEYVFSWSDAVYRYKKSVGGILMEDKEISGSYEILKDWDAVTFFKEVGL